jgi:hypothetical protein
MLMVCSTFSREPADRYFPSGITVVTDAHSEFLSKPRMIDRGLTQRWSELPPRFAVFDFILFLYRREGWLMRPHGGSRSAFGR